MRKPLILMTLGVLALALPVSADIIPNDPGTQPRDARARKIVQDHMERLRVEPIAASTLLSRLRPEEVQYFARRPRSNAVVSGLWLEEWIGAIVYFALVWDTIADNVYRYILLDERDEGDEPWWAFWE